MVHFELGLPPYLGDGATDDILGPLAPGPAIGLVDALILVIAVDHGQQLVRCVGDELGFAAGFLLFFQAFDPFPQGRVFRRQLFDGWGLVHAFMNADKVGIASIRIHKPVSAVRQQAGMVY